MAHTIEGHVVEYLISFAGHAHYVKAGSPDLALYIATEWAKSNCWACPYCDNCTLNHNGDCAKAVLVS